MAGITAAVAALVLHFLHIVEAGALLTMVLLLLALLLVRDLRCEHHPEGLMEGIEEIVKRVYAGEASLETIY